MTARAVTLARAFDFRSAWEGAILAWLRAAAQTPWTQQPPCILTPSRTYAQFLKGAILADGIELLGVTFLTPGECWKRLHAQLGVSTVAASREDLHLLLAAAAGCLPEEASAQAVARDPAPLMRALDHLAASGRPYADLGVRTLAPVLERFENMLAAAGLTAAQRIDRDLLARARQQPPRLGPLLVAGFAGSHWPVWNLLRAAVESAESATVVLFEPRLTAETSDQVWIGSWEQEYGEAALLERADEAAFAALTEAVEAGARVEHAPLTLHVGTTVREEAEAAIVQALRYLSDDPNARIGIAVPGQGPLARELAARLMESGIPHNDVVGHPAPAGLAAQVWAAWLAAQTGPATTPLFELCDLCPRLLELLRVTPAVLRKRFRDAFDELMVDDRYVLAAFSGIPLARHLPLLPERAPFADYLAATLDALNTLPEMDDGKAGLLIQKAAALKAVGALPLARQTFLQWLADAAATAGRTADALGRHPFARVQLIPYDKAEWQEWSHLILTGLNSGKWPPDTLDAPFLGQRRVDTLNLDALCQGSQGEGHLVVREGRGLIHGPAQRSAQVRRQFYNLIESTTRAICVTASLTDERDPSRPAQPSDLLIRLYAAAAGRGLNDAALEDAERRTAAWLASCDRPAGLPSAAPADLQRTAAAYLARRDALQPFGPFEFATARPPSNLSLSCTALERAVHWPELVWMKTFLGVENERWRPDELPWSKAKGLWVHRWLRETIDSGRVTRPPFPALPDPALLRPRLDKARATTRKKAADAFTATGAALPEWWSLVHTQASAMSGRILDELATVIGLGWTLGITEWNLPESVRIALAAGPSLALHGRIDLALSQPDSGACWVLDHKTGGALKLTPGDVGKGHGLQILLYALAMTTFGFDTVWLSAVSPNEGIGNRVDAASLQAAEAVEATLQLLASMQATGTFGAAGDPRTEFGFSQEYPLAMLPVGAAILQAKRLATFQAAAAAEDADA